MNTEKYTDKIPEHLLAGLLAWANKEHPVGHFLTAVLEHDLFEAVGRADDKSMAALRDIVRFVYHEMPSQCHGSREAVQQWRREMEEQFQELLTTKGNESVTKAT